MSRNDSMETELGGLNVFSRTRSYSKAINKAVKSLRYRRAGSQGIPSAIPDRTLVFGCGFLYRVPFQLRSLATFSRPTTPWTCGASTTPAVVHWRNTMDDIMKSSDAWWDLDQLLRVFVMVRKVIGPFGWDRYKMLTALYNYSKLLKLFLEDVFHCANHPNKRNSELGIVTVITLPLLHGEYRNLITNLLK